MQFDCLTNSAAKKEVVPKIDNLPGGANTTLLVPGILFWPLHVCVECKFGQDI